MENKKNILKSLEILFLIGGILYIILGFLSINDNRELIEKLGTNLKIKIKKDQPSLSKQEIHLKLKNNLAIELFIASIIDFILMFICKIYNKQKDEKKIIQDTNISLIEGIKPKENIDESINDEKLKKEKIERE
jgi:hypothetical protein